MGKREAVVALRPQTIEGGVRLQPGDELPAHIAEGLAEAWFNTGYVERVLVDEGVETAVAVASPTMEAAAPASTPRKRGRPKGAKDKRPRKRNAIKESEEV